MVTITSFNYVENVDILNEEWFESTQSSKHTTLELQLLAPHFYFKIYNELNSWVGYTS